MVKNVQFKKSGTNLTKKKEISNKKYEQGVSG
jgi:hypothetical protein